MRSGSLESTSAPAGLQRELGGGEVDRGEQRLALVLARPGQDARARVERALLADLERTALPAQAGDPAGQLQRRARVLGLRGDVERGRLGHERQPRLARGEAVARRLGRPRDRRALGVAAVDVDDAVRRDRCVRQPELLSLEDEGRAAERVEHHEDRARPLRAEPVVVEAGGGPRVVVVAEEPRRPGRLLRQRLEVGDRRGVGLGVPRLVDEDEVVRQVQLVAGLEVADDAVQVLQRHLPHEHPVVVFVDHLADPAQVAVDRLPVLVVPARGARLVAQQRVLGDLGDRVQAQPVDAAVHPEAQHVVHGGHDLGVLPVEVGLLAHEAVQVVLARRSRRRSTPSPTALNTDSQSLGASRQTYQSRLGFSRLERDSTNHGCWSELWFGTQSSTILISRAWHCAISSSRSPSVPKTGSTSQ